MNSTPILIQSDIVTLRAVSTGNYILSSAETSLGPNLTPSTRTRRTASEKDAIKAKPRRGDRVRQRYDVRPRYATRQSDRQCPTRHGFGRSCNSCRRPLTFERAELRSSEAG